MPCLMAGRLESKPLYYNSQKKQDKTSKIWYKTLEKNIYYKKH